MDVKLDDEAMRSLVHKAIFDSISTEKRNELVEAAIKGLLTPKESYPGMREKESLLSTIFNQSVMQVARDIIKEDLSKDDKFITELKKVFYDSWTRLIDDENNRNQLVEKLSDQLSNVIKNLGKDYY